ncbi:hypothetical protein DW2_16505 [Thioclava atlantica]|uniref:Uncharacterized protein n=2 Tax=Thioclava atlantica TaxID=1317124 RepID=A0A085TT00_9RHOB|nr:hypothetical protein DW2_16505 [Thioclava atlantica]
MEAVGRRKAHWLFNAGSDKNFLGKRRPQEDMVTSAVFGSIRLMSPKDRLKAIELLLGRDAFSASDFAEDQDIAVDLWPKLNGPAGRRHVEPDVLLHGAGKTTIVEVKWHAPLSERQLEQQIEAVGVENVGAVILLGEAGIEEDELGVPCFRRTWRDVSRDLKNWCEAARTPLARWVETMRAFLQETDMGRIFNGLPVPNDLGNVAFRFKSTGRPPWFGQVPKDVQLVRYAFERHKLKENS